MAEPDFSLGRYRCGLKSRPQRYLPTCHSEGATRPKNLISARKYEILCFTQDDKIGWRRAPKSQAGIAFGPNMLIFKSPRHQKRRPARGGENPWRYRLELTGPVHPAPLESRRGLFNPRHFPVAAKVICFYPVKKLVSAALPDERKIDNNNKR